MQELILHDFGGEGNPACVVVSNFISISIGRMVNSRLKQLGFVGFHEILAGAYWQGILAEILILGQISRHLSRMAVIFQLFLRLWCSIRQHSICRSREFQCKFIQCSSFVERVDPAPFDCERWLDVSKEKASDFGTRKLPLICIAPHQSRNPFRYESATLIGFLG